MLSLQGKVRLFLCKEPVNMRKSFEGLSGIFERLFPGELLSGAFFIFLNRRRDHIKVLFWDGDGLTIWFKRLEKGSFQARFEGNTSINRKEFLMMLEGVTPKRIQSRHNIF